MADRVFINGRAAVHKGSAGKSIAFPDVCLCPPAPPSGPIPTPLPNTAQAMDLTGGAATVAIEGNPVAHAKSYIAKSTGNEVSRSTGGGIITHQVQGAAYFQTFSMNVFIESQPAVRHLDLLTHNHMAKMPGNTPPAPWVAMMTADAPVAPQQVTRKRKEGKESITIVLLDESGAPLQMDCDLTTPKGDTVEGRPGSTGLMVLLGLAKGKCQLALPRHDARCMTITRSLPKRLPKGAVLYRPGQPLGLETGRRHEVVVPWTINLVVNVCLGDPGSAEAGDQFVLASSDGAYRQALSVRRTSGNRRQHLGLEFQALIPRARYSLERQPSDGGKPHLVFDDCPFDELMAPAQRPVRKGG